MNSGHYRSVIAVDIMLGNTLLVSVPDNRFLFGRVVHARS